jgi:hypothetical protein
MLTNVVPLQQAMKHHMRPEHGTGVERGSRLSQISESLSNRLIHWGWICFVIW